MAEPDGEHNTHPVVIRMSVSSVPALVPAPTSNAPAPPSPTSPNARVVPTGATAASEPLQPPAGPVAGEADPVYIYPFRASPTFTTTDRAPNLGQGTLDIWFLVDRNPNGHPHLLPLSFRGEDEILITSYISGGFCLPAGHLTLGEIVSVTHQARVLANGTIEIQQPPQCLPPSLPSLQTSDLQPSRSPSPSVLHTKEAPRS